MEKEKQTDMLNGATTGMGRRAFVRGAGYTGLGVAAATLMAGRLGVLDEVPGAAALGLNSKKVEAAGITDIDILNFALNLEYLEAEFYTVATTGRRISDFGIGTSGTGTPGETTGGKMVNFGDLDGDHIRDTDSDDEFSNRLASIAKEITYDEQQHVRVLRAALGKYAVAKPRIDLDALGIGFRDYKSFLALSRAFEDTGVSAYGGALPLITSKTYLSVAGRIGLTEALHTANIRLLVAENSVKVPPLDGVDRVPPPVGSQYFAVDNQALAIVRSVSEVLEIVYHNEAAGTNKGGFFPNGVNGKINTV